MFFVEEREGDTIVGVLVVADQASVVVTGAFQGGRHVLGAQTQIDGSIAAVRVEKTDTQLHGDQSDVRAVHSLKRAGMLRCGLKV